MPLDEYEWVDHREVLTFEEITRLADLFVRLGVEKIRLTGGEPLLRRDLEILVGQLAPLDGLKDLCLTTNGSLLAEKVPALKAAGLRRINLSLDTLNPEKFRRIRQRGDLAKVLEGLFAAARHGLRPIKLNAVIERGVNDDDLLVLAEFSRAHGFPLRLIEYMDVGNANDWKSEKLVTKKEMLEVIGARFPLREARREQGSAPAVDYEYVDGGGELGVIASVTEPFCSDCNRARLTAEGKLVTCLFSTGGYDLKTLLRGGATDEELIEAIGRIWRGRTDRYSEERLAALNSPEGYRARKRKLEMIRLGG
jgi:cyclic pyranopterin phosphate synthase